MDNSQKNDLQATPPVDNGNTKSKNSEKKDFTKTAQIANIIVAIVVGFFTILGALVLLVNIRVDKYKEELNDLIAKGKEINEFNATAKDNQRMVALISDFGVDSYYLSAIKSAILEKNKYINIIDITHGIKPFDIVEGAWILHIVTKYLPDETIVWGMVNPGAELKENSIFFETETKNYKGEKQKLYFVGASRDLFDNVIVNQKVKEVYKPAILVEENIVGTTTFAEIINVLQNGGTIKDLEKSHLIYGLQSPTPTLPTVEPIIWNENSVLGYVSAVDGWGNILTNINFNNDFFKEKKHTYSVKINSHTISNVIYGKTFEDGKDETGLLIKQDGYIHFAIYRGCAKDTFNVVNAGIPITIYKK